MCENKCEGLLGCLLLAWICLYFLTVPGRGNSPNELYSSATSMTSFQSTSTHATELDIVKSSYSSRIFTFQIFFVPSGSRRCHFHVGASRGKLPRFSFTKDICPLLQSRWKRTSYSRHDASVCNRRGINVARDLFYVRHEILYPLFSGQCGSV